MVIHIDNNPIEQVKSTKFLGVIINDNLTWSDHLNIPISKVSKGVGVIHRLSRIMLMSCDHFIFLLFILTLSIVILHGVNVDQRY